MLSGDHGRLRACPLIEIPSPSGTVATDDRAPCPVKDSDVQVAPFEIVRPMGPRTPLIAHIPHASTIVPSRVRLETIVLGDSDLQRELVRLTDRHADQLFSWVLELGGCMFVNTLSRLVFDPERFLDDEDEPMAAVGQGAFYTHTTDGARLATIPAMTSARGGFGSSTGPTTKG